MAMEQLAQVVVPRSQIGKMITMPDGFYLIELARMEQPFPMNVILFISARGEIEAYPPRTKTKWGFTIDLEASHLPPPKRVWDLKEFMDTPVVDVKEAFARAREVAEQTIVFDDEKLYDLIVAWAAYTWIRGVFPKNVNLYITGFPGTGKSQVLKFLKYFARYPTDFDPGSEKSYKWHVAQTLGTLMIDEGEYLTKSSVARLRKYHETDVVESRMMGLPMIGLTVIDIRVDAPIAMAATHLPQDTAFLQRGFLIRMTKRKPRIKDFNLIPDIDSTTKIFAKTWIMNWFKVYLAMQTVYDELTQLDLDERVKDLVLPIATILAVVDRDWDWVVDLAQRSFSEANYVTPETMAFMLALARLRDYATKTDRHYIISMTDLYVVLDDVAEQLRANKSRIRYLLQYVFAGCFVARCGDGLCFVCDKETIDHVLASSLPSVDIPSKTCEAIEGGADRKERGHNILDSFSRIVVEVDGKRISFAA